jgi:uncharacterized protein
LVPGRIAFSTSLGIEDQAIIHSIAKGAGAIGVVALTALYPLIAAKRIVGTDIVHAIPLTMVAGLGHMTLGHVDIGVLSGLLAGSIPGIIVGSRLTLHIPDWVLRLTLVTALLIAAYLLWNK